MVALAGYLRGSLASGCGGKCGCTGCKSNLGAFSPAAWTGAAYFFAAVPFATAALLLHALLSSPE